MVFLDVSSLPASRAVDVALAGRSTREAAIPAQSRTERIYWDKPLEGLGNEGHRATSLVNNHMA